MKRRIRIAGASLMIAAGLTAAVAPPATSAPGASVSFSDPGDPCGLIEVSATWTAVEDQLTFALGVIDRRTGDDVIGFGGFFDTPEQDNVSTTFPLDSLEKGKHRFVATFILRDSSGNTLLTGREGIRLPCTRPLN
jgi:hypothetical protein